MNAGGMSLLIGDETFDQKRVRVLGQLRDADGRGSTFGKIESLLTETDGDRAIIAAASTVYNNPVVAGHRWRGAQVPAAGKDGIEANKKRAAERHAVWLPIALALKQRKLELSVSCITHHVEKRYGVPYQTARKVLKKTPR